jgi:hypothetical protein
VSRPYNKGNKTQRKDSAVATVPTLNTNHLTHYMQKKKKVLHAYLQIVTYELPAAYRNCFRNTYTSWAMVATCAAWFDAKYEGESNSKGNF